MNNPNYYEMVDKQFKKIKLPKSWCICSDNSKIFRETVIYYLNIKHKPSMFGNGYNEGSIGCWYGVNKNGEASNMRTDKPLKYFDVVLDFHQFFNAMFMQQEDEIIKLKVKIKELTKNNQKEKSKVGKKRKS